MGAKGSLRRCRRRGGKSCRRVGVEPRSLPAQVCFAQCRHDFAVAEQFGEEVLAFLPYFHRVPLHEPIGVLAGNACLGQRQKHALRMHESRELVQVLQHVGR